MTDEELKAFLADLTAPSLKHNIIIGGCGCCGSPFLEKCEPSDLQDQKYEYGRYLEFT